MRTNNPYFLSTLFYPLSTDHYPLLSLPAAACPEVCTREFGLKNAAGGKNRARQSGGVGDGLGRHERPDQAAAAGEQGKRQAEQSKQGKSFHFCPFENTF